MHVYSKGIGGGVIFYSQRDMLLYLSIYSCKTVTYKIRCSSLTIMPNHVHALEETMDQKIFIAFHRDVESFFAIEYNKEHKRKGPLFMKRFGFAPKAIGKKVRDAIIYIANNPVAGKMVNDVLGYKWNLLAYKLNPFAFSSKPNLSKASRAFRRKHALLKSFAKANLPLTYMRQSLLFDDLDKEESKQLLDIAINLYNPLDYERMSEYFDNSFDNVISVIRASKGAEYDIPEDWEDYSSFGKMVIAAERMGIDRHHCNYESLDRNSVCSLCNMFNTMGFTDKQIRHFLHFDGDLPWTIKWHK